MADHHTVNYYLCQWAASDPVLRADFNEDNYKIDFALNAMHRRVNRIDTQSATLEASAYTKANPQVVTGTYTGDGAASRTIELGFKPKAVLVLSEAMKLNSDAYRACGLVVGDVISTAAAVTDSGFEVYEVNDGGVTWTRTNQSGVKFAYFAFK